MSSEQILADEITFNGLISSCEKASQWEKALLVLGSMQTKMLLESLMGMSATVSACSKGEQWLMALALLAKATS